MRWELSRCPELIRRLGAGSPPIRSSRSQPSTFKLSGSAWAGRKPTVALHFAALRQFARWAGNPLAHVAGVWRLPSGQPSHRRWLTKGQLSRLLSAARGREKVLVALEGLNGLRRVEVLRLRRKDVLLDEECLSVLGKGQERRKVAKDSDPSRREGPPSPRTFDGMPPEGRLFELSASGADGLLQRAPAGSPQRESVSECRTTT